MSGNFLDYNYKIILRIILENEENKHISNFKYLILTGIRLMQKNMHEFELKFKML